MPKQVPVWMRDVSRVAATGVIRADITHAVADLVDQLSEATARMRGADDARRKTPA